MIHLTLANYCSVGVVAVHFMLLLQLIQLIREIS